MKLTKALVYLLFLIVLISCKKEKLPETTNLQELSVSADTLIFKANELKNLFISGKTESEIKFKITSYPDWIKISPDSGVVGKNFVAIEIVSNLISKPSGVYEGKLEITTSFGKKTIFLKGIIDKIKEQKTILTSNVVDAEYSKAKDLLVYVSSNQSKLHIYNTTTEKSESISLNYTPTCVSISSDGEYAVVGHDAHITYVNLNTKSIIKTFNVSCNALDIVLSNNKWAYVFPKVDQWESIRCIDLNLNYENEKRTSDWSIYAGTKAKLHPSGNSIYGTNNGISPSDIEKYNIKAGVAEKLYDSPYHGDYEIGGDLWFSEDGARVFTRGKTVMKVSENVSNDMIYNGTISLQNTNGFIDWLDHSAVKSNLYIIATNKSIFWYDKQNLPFIFVHNSSNLSFKTKIELEKFYVYDNKGVVSTFAPEPYFVFSNSTGNYIYVLTKAVGSGLENEWAIEKIKID